MTMPFILFLDLDGPVCTHRARNGLGCFFDPVAGGMVARLCRETGARIVISSARRRDEGLRDRLAAIGVAEHLFDHPDHWRTGHDPMAVRGNEIDAWLEANPGHDWCIVDDERGGLHPHQIARLVHTDMHAGLSMRDVSRIRRLMGDRGVSDRDVDDAGAQTPRITLANQARQALAALDQGDEDAARAILATIADHPLAQ